MALFMFQRDAKIAKSAQVWIPFRGPHENYVDRKASALLRLFSSSISDLHTPYIVPSENGGREGLRWLVLQSGSASASPRCPAIAIACTPHKQLPSNHQTWPLQKGTSAAPDTAYSPRDGLHFSVGYNSPVDLIAAKHEHELKPGACNLMLDAVHMGVGGDDSWTPSVCASFFFPSLAPLSHQQRTAESRI
jgi:beta-galactosidase